MASNAVREQIDEKELVKLAPTVARVLPESYPSARRVLFVDHTAAISGGEIALANLVQHLNSRKVKAIVLLGADGPLVERLHSVEVHILPLSSSIASQKKDLLGFRSLLRIKDVFGLVGYIFLLARFIRGHEIEIVHTNSLKSDIIGGIAGRIAACHVVWHVRDRIENDYLPGPVVRIFRFLARIIPDYVIANSTATLRTLRLPSDALATSIPSGVEVREKAAVVHDGTATVEASPTARSNSEFRVGLIGRISPWKGQHIFIQAAALVRQRFPQVRFVIIGAALFGEEEYEKEVRQLPRQLGVEQTIEFAGFRKDVNEALAELDLVVHASTKGEPFGQVIIEGMAAGKPVVATNGGGVPEIVEDGRTGILVPMEDPTAMAEAICQILAAPDRAQEMGRRGRERVAEHFTLDQTARRVEAVYEEMFRRSTSQYCGSEPKVRRDSKGTPTSAKLKA